MTGSFPRTVLLAVILAASVSACSKPLSQEELLARAQQAFNEGDLNAAFIDTRTALQQDVTSAEGRRLLGEVFLRQRNLEEAAIEFGKSLEAAQDVAVAGRYAEALLGAGDPAKLLELHQDDAFAFVAQDPTWLALVARAQVQTGDGFTAASTVESAAALNPDDRQVKLSQAIIAARHTGDLQAATEILRSLTETNPDFADAWSLYGSLTQASGDREQAELAFAEAASLNPLRFEDRLNVVAVRLEQSKFAEAATEVERLEKLIPDHPRLNHSQGHIFLHEGDAKKALEELNLVLNVAPGYPPSLYLAAHANFREGNLATAERQISTFLASQAGNVNARQLLASIYLQLGEPARTVTITREILEDEPMNTQVMSLLALALSAQGMHTAGADVYQDVVAISPDSASSRMEFGTALMRAGDRDRGIAELEIAKALDPENGDIRMRLMQARVAQGDAAGARAEVEKYLQDAPDSPLPLILAAQMALSADERAEAAGYFTRALELDPASVEARQGLVIVAMLEDDPTTAITLLEEGLVVTPGELRPYINLAAVHEQSGNEEAMVGALERAIAAHREALDPRLMLARYHFREQRVGEAVSLLTEVRNKYDSDPRLHQVLVGSYLALGDTSAAVTAGRRLASLMPESAVALRLAAEAERANGDFPASEVLLRKVVSLEPDDAAARKTLIDVLLQQSRLEPAREQLALLPEGAAPAHQLDLIKGRIALALGDLDSGEELLRKSYEAQPTNGSLMLLTTALIQQSESAAAVELMEAWIESNPEDGVVLNQLAGWYMTNDRDSDAIEAYETLYAMAPEDPIVLNNLAWAYREMDPENALNYVQQALAVAPESAAIQDTHAMILLEQGKYQEALAVNQKTLDASSGAGSSQFSFHRALILEASGDKSGAIAILKTLLAGDDFADKAEAQALLARLE